MKKLLVVALVAFILAACGSSNGTGSYDTPRISDADIEVDSYKWLPSCTERRFGETAYVIDLDQGYVCIDGMWVEDDNAVKLTISSSSNGNGLSSSSKGNGLLPYSENNELITSNSSDIELLDSALRSCAPVFANKYMTYNGRTYRCYDDFWRPENDPPENTDAQVICLKTTDPNAPLKCYLDTAIWSSSSYQASPEDFVDQGVIEIRGGSITGVAQKGPYLQGSTYRIIPLNGKTLEPTGDTLSDQFNNSQGTYTFCDLNLPSQYAMIEASGFFRSELTGKKSNLQMTIGAIVDVQKGANINMITNLEYERVKYLVQNEGYNIAGAKKRALTEVLSAFHIENVTGSAEQLDITQNGAANGALLAISIMIQGVAGSEFNVVDMMKDFREDLKDDGQWTGVTARTKIADIAYVADSAGKFAEYRRNIADWKLSNVVPDFEQYINDFWGSEYGIGKCTESRFGEIKKNQNVSSRHKENYFVCDTLEYSRSDYRWRNIEQFEYNTRNQVCDVDGLIIPGNIDKDMYYICDYGEWRLANDSEVSSYYTECSADGKISTFDDGKKYVCDDDIFRLATKDEILYNRGCVSYIIGKSVHLKYTDYFDSVITCERSGYWDLSFEQVNSFVYGSDGGIKTIQIGKQVWMAEDYGNRECPYASKDRTCPSGWKLPSSQDWKELLQYVYKKEPEGKSYLGYMQSTYNVLSKESDFYGFGGTTKGYVMYVCGTSCVEMKSDTTNMYYWGSDSLLVAGQYTDSYSKKYYNWNFVEDNADENVQNTRQTKQLRVRCVKK